jgi:hypothetical protein
MSSKLTGFEGYLIKILSILYPYNNINNFGILELQVSLNSCYRLYATNYPCS